MVTYSLFDSENFLQEYSFLVSAKWMRLWKEGGIAVNIGFKWVRWIANTSQQVKESEPRREDRSGYALFGPCRLINDVT